MNTFLIKTVSDIEMLIGDLKARIVPEEEFKKKVRSLAQDILNDAMDEDINRDLDAGKVVMGHRKNPVTGKIEEVKKEDETRSRKAEYESWVFTKLAEAFGMPKDYAERHNSFQRSNK